MSPDERQRIIQVLRPFARLYVGLPAEQQIALASWTQVRVDYLRDAYLMVASLEKVVTLRA